MRLRLSERVCLRSCHHACVCTLSPHACVLCGCIVTCSLSLHVCVLCGCVTTCTLSLHVCAVRLHDDVFSVSPRVCNVWHCGCIRTCTLWPHASHHLPVAATRLAYMSLLCSTVTGNTSHLPERRRQCVPPAATSFTVIDSVSHLHGCRPTCFTVTGSRNAASTSGRSGRRDRSCSSCSSCCSALGSPLMAW